MVALFVFSARCSCSAMVLVTVPGENHFQSRTFVKKKILSDGSSRTFFKKKILSDGPKLPSMLMCRRAVHALRSRAPRLWWREMARGSWVTRDVQRGGSSVLLQTCPSTG